LLRLFATYNAIWLPQEVRVDCKKNHSRVGVAEKKPKNTNYSSFCKKKTLIDVDCC
jgi:hypothetical protein